MIKKWKKLPEWVQWIIYFPCVVIFSALAGLLASLPVLGRSQSNIGSIIVGILAALVATTVFYWSAFYLAPRLKKLIAGILYLIFMFLWCATLVRITYEWGQGLEYSSTAPLTEVCQAIVAILWGSYLFISAFRSDEPMEL